MQCVEIDFSINIGDDLACWLDMKTIKKIIVVCLFSIVCFSSQGEVAQEKTLNRVEQEQEFLKQKLQKYEKVIEIMDKKMSESSTVQAQIATPKAQGQTSVANNEYGWNDLMVVLVFGLLIAIVGLEWGRMGKNGKKKKPDTQRERLSKFAWMSDTGPEFRLFFKEMESFFKKGKELRSKRDQFGDKERESFRAYVLGRWILGESTFEEEDRIAEEAVKHVIATFPTKQNHATNRMLLKEAAIMVLRGQKL
jgi:hypothetical protein